VTDLSEQPCNRSDNFDKVVTSCQQVIPNLLTTCDKQCEYILLTACWQTCYKMHIYVRFLRVYMNLWLTVNSGGGTAFFAGGGERLGLILS
jgi:hypothetical protein